jgi:protein-tyrosine phosphatase
MKSDKAEANVPIDGDCCNRCLDATIEGALNLRDLGGHRAGSAIVRRGMLYRSAMTHEITADGMRMLATAHGLRTLIDLRSDEEIQEYGIAPYAVAGVAYYHSPVSSRAASPPEIIKQYQQEMRDGVFDWTASYLRMVQNSGAAFRRVFEVLAAPEGMPGLFHCIAGRDRTGVAAALLLGALGVSADDIAEDYALTGSHLRRQPHRFARQAERLGLDFDRMTGILETEAEAMHRFLDEITRRHGSIEATVLSFGVAESTIQTLRGSLLEPATILEGTRG